MKNSRIAKENIEYEKKMNEYYLKCFLLEFSKICIFFIFFSLLGLIPEYLIALLSLMLLRSNGGGLHYKHYISCLAVSFLFLCGSITLATYITPPTILACFTSLLCSLIGYWLVPIASSNRPPATVEQAKKSKRNTMFIILEFIILICICPHNTYIFIGYWTIILHIFQLVIARILKEVKKIV